MLILKTFHSCSLPEIVQWLQLQLIPQKRLEIVIFQLVKQRSFILGANLNTMVQLKDSLLRPGNM